MDRARRSNPGSRRCDEWLVRITSAQGRLSGMVSHARATVPIQI
jgi:hypothetical protein